MRRRLSETTMTGLVVGLVVGFVGLLANPACSSPPGDFGFVAIDGSPLVASDARTNNIGPTWPADTPLPDEFDFPPFLTMPEPGRVVVGFRTSIAATAGVTLQSATSEARTIVASTNDDQFFSADLGALEPATAYSYTVHIDGTSASRRGVFFTPGSATWRFVHMAEFHAASEVENVARFAEHIRSYRPHLLIESGDMLDDGNNIEGWRSYFRTSAPWISNVIILPIGSNHVTGPGGNGFLQHFFALPNNERWYTTRFSQLQIFSLDSTYGAARPEIEAQEPNWLASELTAMNGDDPPLFVVGAWHYPACSTRQSGRWRSREWVMEHFVDTFLEAASIDLILTGHDKYYERSLIDGAIPHITTAAGKLAPSVGGNNHERCTPIRTNVETHSILFGGIQGDRLSLRAIDPQGEPIDALTIDAR